MQTGTACACWGPRCQSRAASQGLRATSCEKEGRAEGSPDVTGLRRQRQLACAPSNHLAQGQRGRALPREHVVCNLAQLRLPGRQLAVRGRHVER